MLWFMNLGTDGVDNPGASPAVAATVTLNVNFAYEVYIKGRNDAWEHTQIVFTGENFGEVIT